MSIYEPGNGQYADKQSLSSEKNNHHGRDGFQQRYTMQKVESNEASDVDPSWHKVQQSLEMELLAIRRTRINRILVRRRRHERQDQSYPRLFIATFVLLLVIVIFVSSGAGGAFAYYQAQLPLLNGIAEHSLFQTTHIYDRNGKLLYNLYDHNRDDRGRRTYVNYADISPLLIEATVAAEDRTFWTNSGVDYLAIVRAASTDIQNQGAVEGASTITQQLIKKQFFADLPRTIQVKSEEAILATGLTQQYPKWKIMEMYLNTIFYGDGNYGVEAAAQDYFGLKPLCTKQHCIPAVGQLNLAQASLLAGLPRSPTNYEPTVYKDRALTRQKQVLQSMLSLNYVTTRQVSAAQQAMANYKFVSYSSKEQMQAPHFVNYIINDVLIPLLGAQNLYDGGYNIYTTVDLDLEKKVEQIVYNHLYQRQEDSYLGPYGPLNVTNNVNNGAAVVIDPATGELLAMDGSANYHNDTPTMQGEFNAATAERQPGSSFKPVLYSTAFEMGWYPAMIIPDHKTYYPDPSNPTKPYSPQNYDGTFHTGFPMTVRNAIANSFNIPAIDALEFTGMSNVENMAGRLGLSEVANQPLSNLGPSMALGTKEVSLLHLTAAYATFANRGVRVPTTSILEITDNQGQPIYKFDAAHPQGIRAVREDIAYLMSSILSDKQARYHEFFPGNPLELDRPAAAKTGTTDSFRDNWTMGYTPHLAVGVWAGNSDNSVMNNVIGITGAGPIWHDIMEYTSQHYNFPADDFVKPDDVHEGAVSAFTGLQPHLGEPTVTDWFIDGTLPTIQGGYTPPPPPPLVPSTTVTPTPCQGNNCNNTGGQNSQNGLNNQSVQVTPDLQLVAVPIRRQPGLVRKQH